VSSWNVVPDETPIDISGLKLKGIGSRSALNRFEAENIRKAVVKYLAVKPGRRTAPFTLNWAMRLHKEMFGEVWRWAGKFRKENLIIGSEWHQVPLRVQSLLDDLLFWESHEPSTLVQAVRLHHRAVQIHPFLNGNGRWARLLSNIWLIRHDHSVTEWPEHTIGNRSVIRDEYIAAIKSADDGVEEPLIELHSRYTRLEPRGT
jgi:Fic-DOC domain mobile mystery protein B